MHPLVIFVASLFVGFILGFFLAALLRVGHEADEWQDGYLAGEEATQKDEP